MVGAVAVEEARGIRMMKSHSDRMADFEVVQELRKRLLYYYALAKGGRAAPNRGSAAKLLLLTEEEEKNFIPVVNSLVSAVCSVRATSSGVTVVVTDGQRDGEIKEVFGYWLAKTDRSAKHKLTNGRRARIRARLKEGYSVEQLKQAIDGVLRSRWHMGHNPNRTRYDRISTVFRDGGQVEHFAGLVAEGHGEAERRRKGVRLPEDPSGNGSPGRLDEAL